MTNEQVVKAWIRGEYAQSNNMRSDGGSLFSYEMKIGQTMSNGEKQVLNVQSPYFYSQTTSQHVGLAKQYADKVVKPVPVHSYMYGGGWYVFP